MFPAGPVIKCLLFPAGPVIKCFVIPPTRNYNINCEGTRPDHLSVESSCCCFARVFVSFGRPRELGPVYMEGGCPG